MASTSATLSPPAVPARAMVERASAQAVCLTGHGEVVHPPLTLAELSAGRTDRTWKVDAGVGRRWVLRERERSGIPSANGKTSVMYAVSERGLHVSWVVGHSGTRSKGRFMVTEYARGTNPERTLREGLSKLTAL